MLALRYARSIVFDLYLYYKSNLCGLLTGAFGTLARALTFQRHTRLTHFVLGFGGDGAMDSARSQTLWQQSRHPLLTWGQQHELPHPARVRPVRALQEQPGLVLESTPHSPSLEGFSTPGSGFLLPGIIVAC